MIAAHLNNDIVRNNNKRYKEKITRMGTDIKLYHYITELSFGLNMNNEQELSSGQQ